MRCSRSEIPAAREPPMPEALFNILIHFTTTLGSEDDEEIEGENNLKGKYNEE